MDSSGTSKPVAYSDLLAIIKEGVQLRSKLMTKPSDKDIRDYKLFIKAFEAYTRIKEHPDIAIDTIASVVGSKTDDINTLPQEPSKTVTTTQQPSQSTNNVIYLFGNNQQDQEAISDTSEIDSDMDPDELFDDEEPPEKLPDDNDVEQMLKKSSFQLSRALNSRNYIVTEESESDDEANEDPTENKNPSDDNIIKTDVHNESQTNPEQTSANDEHVSKKIEDDAKSSDQKSVYRHIDYDDEINKFEQINSDEEDDDDIYRKFDNDIYGGYNSSKHKNLHKSKDIVSYFGSGYDSDVGSDGEYHSGEHVINLQ